MAIVKLNVNEKVLDRVLWLLSQFKKEEVEIIKEDADYFTKEATVAQSYSKLEEPSTEFISLEELNRKIDKVIKKYED